MRAFFAFAVVAVLAAVPAIAQDEVESSDDSWGDPMSLVGEAAPGFSLQTVGGEDFELASLEGEKTLVATFWATWCPWCRRASEHFQETAEKYADRDDLVFVMISVGQSEEEIEDYLDDNDIDADELAAAIVLDPDRDAADKYWVDYIPHVVVIDPDLNIAEVAFGQDRVTGAIDEFLTAMDGGASDDAGDEATDDAAEGSEAAAK